MIVDMICLIFWLQLHGHALCRPGPWPYHEKEEINASHYCILILPAASWPQGTVWFFFLRRSTWLLSDLTLEGFFLLALF